MISKYMIGSRCMVIALLTCFSLPTIAAEQWDVEADELPHVSLAELPVGGKIGFVGFCGLEAFRLAVRKGALNARTTDHIFIGRYSVLTEMRIGGSPQSLVQRHFGL